YFSWSGVSCNAALTIAIRASVNSARFFGLNCAGPIGEGACANAAGDNATKSAVAPAVSNFNIDDLRREWQPPRNPIENELYRAMPQSHVGPKAKASEHNFSYLPEITVPVRLSQQIRADDNRDAVLD